MSSRRHTATELFANLEHWADAFHDAIHAPSGMEALVQLLSYISWVCTDAQYNQFCETLRKRLPEAEETVMTHAETMIEQGRKEGHASLLIKQLTLKFGPLPPEYKAIVSTATLEQLEHLAARVLFVEELSSVFTD